MWQTVHYVIKSCNKQTDHLFQGAYLWERNNATIRIAPGEVSLVWPLTMVLGSAKYLLVSNCLQRKGYATIKGMPIDLL